MRQFPIRASPTQASPVSPWADEPFQQLVLGTDMMIGLGKDGYDIYKFSNYT